MIHPKVVSLQADRARSAPIPPIVNSIRQQSRRQLIGLLNNLLDCTDDALFEMADKSHNNLDHHLYFDSMRQIRLHRETIQKSFVDEVNRAFDRLFTGSQNGTGDAEDGDPEEIQLLNNDELEISVAISGIVSKITSQFSLPIMEVTKRLDHLAKHATVIERRNPLGPQMVSEAFVAAMSCLDVDIRIRIILLKLFERTVMQNMGPVYDETNHMLVQAGVLKDLRSSLSRNRDTDERRAHPAEAPRHPSVAGPQQWRSGSIEGSGHAASFSSGSIANGGAPGAGAGYSAGDFGVIQSLLAGIRNSGGQPPAPGTIIATPQLLRVLDAAQAEFGQQQIGLNQVPPLVDLRQLVASRAANLTGRPQNNLSRNDEDVVNFIGMLFDYILNDRNLAIPMKALIARLQIPIVKLAILDKGFFEKSSHPARQLLNELSSAGIGWSSASELKRDAVYDRIESVIIRVLNGFNDNPLIFEQLLQELRDFRTQDSARNARMEQRVKETETGKAKTLAAKQEVQQFINQKVAGLRLPREVGRFLSEVWSRVLVYAMLTEGESSAVWQALMSTLDDLLWSVQPLDHPDQMDQRDQSHGALLQRLTAGMNVVQLAAAEQGQWLEIIQDQLEEVSQNDRRYFDEGSFEEGAIAGIPEQYVEMEQIILAEPTEVTDSYLGQAPDAEFADQIARMTEGTWVEFHSDPSSPALRCKLTTIVEPGARYVFVNRRGMKVAEKTRMALARELQDHKLTILNDAQVFDRALEAVIGNLRHVQSKEARR